MSVRISTSTMFETGTSRIGELQSGLSKIQQQLSTGRKLITPADDPLGAAKVLDLSQGQSINTQYTGNRTSARNVLNEEDNTLQSITDLMQDLRTDAVYANNGSLDDAARHDLAIGMRTKYEQLLGLANSRDSAGNYLFAGYQDRSQPFSSSNGRVQYAGDAGDKMLQVSANRRIPAGDSGDALFMSVPASGITTAVSSGAAKASAVTVSDPNALTGHNYDLVFDGSGGYAVFDATLDPGHGSAPLAGGSYAPPQQITVDGLQMTVSGSPAAGDSIALRPARSQSVFKTLDDMITALEQPAGTAADRDKLNHNLAVASANIDNALDNFLAVRASVGSRLKELDSLDDYGSGLDLQYSQHISDIQDVDYVKAISDFTQKQTILQAAQQSFVKVSGLSLFNYL